LGGWRWRFPGEILVVAWSQPAAATPAGAVDFLGSAVRGSSSWSLGLDPEGNLRSSRSEGEADASFSSLGPSSQNRLRLGDWWMAACMLLSRLLARGRCGQFGNDDVSSRVWAAVGALVVGLRHVRWFSRALLCHCGVGAAVECVPMAMMMDGL
jgi:hypothetical protein